MRYRSEIDGMRAIAVIPVMLFHAGLATFSGGFVGVDVFFVISGYLITQLIYVEINEDRFSILNFYERRIRRLLPALMFVCLACLPFAWFWMIPNELKDFGESLVAVNLFSSNVLFWLESDYFAADSELKPLLHTWSLGVEEQFYLFFPLLLLLWQRLRLPQLGLFVLILSVLSLICAQWLGQIDPTANFYLLPTRAWEMGIGALLALHSDALSGMSNRLRELGGALGLALIVGAIFAFDAATPFPGVYALVPTLGTALIIACANNETLVGKLLSLKGFVMIGLISYSAYLWHQPVYAFARLRIAGEVPQEIMLGLAMLSLLLAYFTWRFVEAPFRNRQRVSRTKVLSGAALSWLFFVGIGTALWATDGAPERNMSAADVEHRIRHNTGLGRCCPLGADGVPVCRTAEGAELLVWGDSYAKHLVNGILASNPDADLIQLTKARCGPVPGVTVASSPNFTTAWGDECIQFNDDVMSWLRNNQDSVKFVALGSPFLNYLNEDAQIYTRRAGLIDTDVELVLHQFRETLTEIKAMGITPVVFAPPLKTGANIGACLMRHYFLQLDLDACNLTAEELEAEPSNARVQAFLQQVEADNRVIWLPQLMGCNEGSCPSHIDGLFLYRDWGHLSVEGSEYLGKTHDLYKQITR